MKFIFGCFVFVVLAALATAAPQGAAAGAGAPKSVPLPDVETPANASTNKTITDLTVQIQGAIKAKLGKEGDKPPYTAISFKSQGPLSFIKIKLCDGSFFHVKTMADGPAAKFVSVSGPKMDKDPIVYFD